MVTCERCLKRIAEQEAVQGEREAFEIPGNRARDEMGHVMFFTAGIPGNHDAGRVALCILPRRSS